MEKEEPIKEYELRLNNSSCLLTMKIEKNEKIIFQIRTISNIVPSLYHKEFNLEEILTELSFPKENYDTISKIFKFYDDELSKNNITLIPSEQSIKLCLKKGKEVELILEEKKLSNEEALNIIYNDIIELKIKNNREEKDKKEIENKLNKLTEENKMMKKENEEMKNQIKSLSEENTKLKTTFDMLHERFKDFKYNRKKPAKPENLRFIDYLTNKNIKSGPLAVFTGITDNIDYLIYNNKNNLYLDIMTLKDKIIINSLKGHNAKVSVIKYFSKDNKEEYLLSCDENKITIIWDIQNDYNKKYTMKENYFGNIFDSLLVFNVLNKDYLILSSGNLNEFTKVYELMEEGKIQFTKNISGTNKSSNNCLINWEYKNKNYIIELCDKKIIINSLLDDECYATLIKDPEGYHFSGFIYNYNLLCVNDGRNNFVRIWDLINKNVYKQINFDGGNAYEIIPWNKSNAIIGCKGCFIVIDIEEGKEKKKIMLDNVNHYLRGLKKIKMIQLGECLIGSDDNCNIRLFSI